MSLNDLNETTAKMLERVRALLAKAESTQFPEEAETFRAKADELMTRHAIDSFMLDKAKPGAAATVRPERRDFNRSWRYSSRFGSELFSMFLTLADHCRCVVGHRGANADGLPVYGLKSDLDYLDMLFTTVSLEVAKNLQPGVDPAGEVGHEVFKQRQAGIAWPEITRKMYAAALVSLTKGEADKQLSSYWTADEVPEGGWPWERLIDDVRTSLKNRLANANRRYVKANGLDAERNYVKPEIYQRSFIQGFDDEINSRVWDMKRRTQKSYDATNQAKSFAVALRDVREMAIELYKQEFPPPPPVDLSTLPPVKPSRRRVAKYVPPVTDPGAVAAGRRKAAQTDLSSPNSRVRGSGPSLPSGS